MIGEGRLKIYDILEVVKVKHMQKGVNETKGAELWTKRISAEYWRTEYRPMEVRQERYYKYLVSEVTTVFMWMVRRGGGGQF